MTQKTLSKMLLIVIISLVAFRAAGNVQTVVKSLDIIFTQGLAKEPVNDLPVEKQPFFPAPVSKEEHGKAHTPQMDETAHIHKFHKERVKKIKKHHSKFWILSQIILVICHLSILIIAF